MHLTSSSNNELAGHHVLILDPDHAFALAISSIVIDLAIEANNLEHSMILDAVNATADATIANRRFRPVRGRATSFLGFEDVSYKRVHGRFGGDTGNRKRRVETRIDDTIEHNIRTRVSKREALEAIEYGVSEYEKGRRQAIMAQRNAGARTLHAFDGTPIPVTPEGMIRHGRTGALVEVVRKSPRAIKKTALAVTAATTAAQRPRLTAGEVRAKLGLPAKG